MNEIKFDYLVSSINSIVLEGSHVSWVQKTKIETSLVKSWKFSATIEMEDEKLLLN